MDKEPRESHDPTGTLELMIEFKYSVASGGQALPSLLPWARRNIIPRRAWGGHHQSVSVRDRTPIITVLVRSNISALGPGTHAELASTQRSARSGSEPSTDPRGCSLSWSVGHDQLKRWISPSKMPASRGGSKTCKDVRGAGGRAGQAGRTEGLRGRERD